MKQIGTCKIHFLSEAVSPITHMGGVSGNEAILNRGKVVYKNHVIDVPVISGNALRHRLVREPGALHLINTCGLRGELNIDQANFLLTGGSLTESSTTDNIPLIGRMQTVSPLLRLLGGSLKNQIVGGSLFVSRGLLACEENREAIQKMCPSALGAIDGLFMLAQSFIGNTQYTRGDATRMKDATDIIGEGCTAKEKQNLMIYSGECVIPGAIFYHNMTLYNVSPLEVGAVLNAIYLWQSTNRTIGGSARIGHGELDSSIMIEGLTDWFGSKKEPADLVAEYCRHTEENADNFRKWLCDAFGQTVKRKKKASVEPHTCAEGAF